MSTTLSHGYKKPSTGDRGSVWFANLEDNITLSNSHDHDGTDGEAIAAKYITKATDSVAAGSWVAVAGQAGTFSQTKTLPSGYLMATTQIHFLDPNGHPLMLSVEKASATTYTVFINDNSLTLTAVYG